MKIVIWSLFFCTLLGYGQDPTRFENEVKELQKRYDSIWDASQETLLFTGSSSVRMWKTLNAHFPELQIINTGFGGSQASDLLYYLDPLVLQYKPSKIFIYEGDNDLAEGKRPGVVKKTLLEIIGQIQVRFPDAEIILIAAKPSISRWKLRGKYRRLNRKMERLTRKNDLLAFADVWTPMLINKKLNHTIFIEDGLHMNEDGYLIWLNVIQPFIH